MSLSIEAEWEQIESGSPEERACFAAIGIFADDVSLTQAQDLFVKRIRTKVHLSAYHLAEWLAWNWWRLRWEPRTSATDWQMAHHMTTIGGGYVWPNISIISDGERVVLLCKPTVERPQEPLRYIADFAAVVRATDYEKAINRYIEQVQGQLRAEGVRGTNLDTIWADVCSERTDSVSRERRRLEAMLGREPDEASEVILDKLLAEVGRLGEGAVREIAATSAGCDHVVTAEELEQMATEHGFDAQPRNSVKFQNGAGLSPVGEVPAWRRGVEAARALRTQEHLGQEPISNKRLAEMSGVAVDALTDLTSRDSFSFAIDDKPATSGRVVLRSRWENGRRFDLARLLGDRLVSGEVGRLFPATTAGTYRQKYQRAFAAEFLCPFAAVEHDLAGDYSDELQEDVAAHFMVSPLTVRTLLVNHGRIEREDLEGHFEAA